MRGTVIKVRRNKFILMTEDKLVLDNFITKFRSAAIAYFIRKFPDMIISDDRWEYHAINNKIYKISATKVSS